MEHGGDAAAVTAIPDAGYHFVQWSDGSTDNPRTDTNVTANLSVTASFANDAPVIAAVADQSVLEDSGSASVTIHVSDLESAAATLVVTAASSDAGVLSHPVVTAGSNADERVLTFAPLAQQNGVVTVTLNIGDPAGGSSQRSFDVTVNAVNDAPTLTLGTLATHAAATSGAQSVPGFASVDFGPANEDTSQAVDDFLIDSISDSDGVLAGGAVDLANDGTLNYTLSGIGGSATVALRVRDNGGTANGGLDTSTPQSFAITVVPGADLQIAEGFLTGFFFFFCNHRVGPDRWRDHPYAIVVANAGPNPVVRRHAQRPVADDADQWFLAMHPGILLTATFLRR